MLGKVDVHRLLTAIEITTVLGLLDRTLIAVMLFTITRVNASVESI